MAISYPRDLHSYELIESTFELITFVGINRLENNRAISAVDHLDPYWEAKFITRRLYQHERAAWKAWKDSLRGGMQAFLAYDITRKYPIAYPNGVPEIIATTWNGQGDVTALSGRLITCTGAPSGFTLKPGDMVGLVESGAYGLFRVTEEVVATSSIAIPVEPLIPLTLFSTSAVAYLYRPKAMFTLDPESWDGPANMDFASISFSAIQRYK